MPNNDQKVPRRTVLILAFAGAQAIDIAGPAQVLTTANEEGATPSYDVQLAAFEAGPVVTASGFAMLAGAIPPVGEIDTIIVPGGPGVHDIRKNPAVRDALSDLSQRARRICTVCTGAFLLAETGILNGRTAVTHWRSCDRLAREFPAINVDPEPLYVNDGPIWTTAGVTAGIDLILNLVQQDHDAALAARVARRLVVYMRRAGWTETIQRTLGAAGSERGTVRQPDPEDREQSRGGLVGGADGGDGRPVAPHVPPPFSNRDGGVAIGSRREDQVRSRPLASSYHRTEPWTDRRANRLRVRNPAATGDGPVLWHQPQ
jgi:putative intracellular protease/amidase